MTTTQTQAALPQLRYRTDTGDGYFVEPVTIEGFITGMTENSVTISRGTRSVTELALEDLFDTFGGVENTFSLLMDAAFYDDLVRISLTPEKISYDNGAQYKRIATAANE